MKWKSYISNAGFLLVLIFVSCEDFGGGDCGSGGFCDVTVCGTVGNVDTDDWRPLIIGSTDTVRLSAACPNPAAGSTRFGYAIPRADSIVITLNDKPNSIVRNLASERFNPGNYLMQIDLSGLRPDIYRLYFHVIRGSSTYSSYGDIRVIQ